MPVLCFQFQQPQVSLFWRLVTIWSSQVPQPSCNSLPKASESVSPAKFGQRSSKVIEIVVYSTSECCPMSQFFDKAKFMFFEVDRLNIRIACRAILRAIVDRIRITVTNKP